MKKLVRNGLRIVMTCCLLLSATSMVAANDNELLGAGASFPYPLYSKMFDAYHKKTGVKINYQSIGSGGGIRQLTAKAVDFGASDAFLSDKKMKSMPAPVLHVPVCLGAVAVTYNLPGNPTIKLDQSALADIFLGKIKKWNDPRIKKLNPGVKLPGLKVVFVHRSDGSGTTNIFTDYLCKISPEWKKKVGVGKSVKWPRGGLGAKGNEGVSGFVKQMPGSIGYCELAYTIQNKMPQAKLKNKSGEYIAPSLESASLAAAGDMPADTRVSITDSDAKGAYPIAGFTWILIYKEQAYNKRSKGKVKTMVNLLFWMIQDGQKYTKPLDYAPLPKPAQKIAEKIIKSVRYNGKNVQ